jgi:hypothetical protein
VNDQFIHSQMDRLEDFWRRRESAAAHRLEYSAYGHPLHLTANDPLLLEAARVSSGRYTRCDPPSTPRSMRLHLILDRQRPAEPLPLDWPSRLRYMAVGPWLTISGEPWLHAFADMRSFAGVALVSPTLARHTLFLSRCVCDTFTLNMLMRTGVGMVHASCLSREGKALLLAGPHNAGKSATALRLALNDYRLLADGMTYVRTGDQGLELLGYPVGEAKLRLDMLDSFPQLQGYGEAALVREDTKMVFNLREAMPERMMEDSIRPEQIVLCHLERLACPTTRVEPMDREELLRRLWPESSFVDDMEVMHSNLTAVRSLLEAARCYRLKLGSRERSILQTLEDL